MEPACRTVVDRVEGLVSMVIPSFLCLSRTRQRHMKADQPSGDPGGSQQLCLREMELLESDLHCY